MQCKTRLVSPTSFDRMLRNLSLKQRNNYRTYQPIKLFKPHLIDVRHLAFESSTPVRPVSGDQEGRKSRINLSFQQIMLKLTNDKKSARFLVLKLHFCSQKFGFKGLLNIQISSPMGSNVFSCLSHSKNVRKARIHSTQKQSFPLDSRQKNASGPATLVWLQTVERIM